MPDAKRPPGLIPTLAAVVAVVVTAYLGNWQLDRAAYKLELQERYADAARQPAIRVPAGRASTDALAYRRVEAVGAFRPEKTVFLDNRVRDGAVGYEVVTPLQLENSDRVVLVNRGWIRASPERRELPSVSTPNGTVSVQGVALPPQSKFFELSPQAESGRVWQNLKFDKYAEAFKVDPQPILLLQDNDTRDGLRRDWPSPATGVDRHRAYALQWFVMSGVIILIYLTLYVKAKQERKV